MFMSTRYKKRDPEWKKRPLFAVEDSLAKLLNCLSIEYSVSKLISPKYKNFRSQKIKFESKTRINNAIWRAWHIQYKSNKRPRLCQFAPPFSDQTVHSTPQAVILEGKKWKRRLDIVSRKYKKWRKFYNYKILKGENGADESESLKELSNENSEDEFLSEEEEDTKLRLSPNKNSEQKNGAQNQVFFQSPEFMMDTFVADLPDTLFSSIRTVKANENGLGFQFTDLSDMIQPTLDQLNPCFDDLLENFNFLTDELNSLPGSKTLETVEEQPGDTSLDGMMNLESNSNQMQQGLLDERMYTDPLDTASAYLYSSQFLLTSSSSEVSPKQSSTDVSVKPFTTNTSQRQTAETGKREVSKEGRDIAGNSPPRKILIKDNMDINQFESSRYPSSSAPNQASIAPRSPNGSELQGYKPNFETILSNTIASSGVSQSASSFVGPFNSQSKVDSFISTSSRSIQPSIINKDVDMKTVSESPAHKLIVSPNASARALEYSELPPQLQAPNLTAHLQAVMSARPKPPANLGAIPRNKSDTHLASLAKAEKTASYTSQIPRKDGSQTNSIRRDSAPSIPARLKRGKLPRNMSDTSLVQLAKDSTKVSSRRRQSSVSIDTRPIILPKNLSESNLFALAAGTSKRPQPILPKNLVAIAPSTQPKTVGILPKVSVSSAGSDANATAGQFTTFVVNKQQPCNAEPVQVKLYMPKSKQIASNLPSANIKGTASASANVLPQRVEVIQYQGSNQVNITNRQDSETASSNTLKQNQPKAATLLHHAPSSSDFERSAFQKFTQSQSVGVANQGSASNRIAYVSPVASVSVGMRSNTSLLNVSTGNLASESQNQQTQLTPVISNSFSMTSVANSTPSVVTQTTVETKPVSVAPLQGLSEQQLVNLAQVLQGTGSGNLRNENTIAYLEMLQQQLNTLLLQQQAMLKSQQSNAEVSQQSGSQQQQQGQNVQQQQQIGVQQVTEHENQLNQQNQQIDMQQLAQQRQNINIQHQQQQQQQMSIQQQQQNQQQHQFNVQQRQNQQQNLNLHQGQQQQLNIEHSPQNLGQSNSEIQLQDSRLSQQQPTTQQMLQSNAVSTYLSSMTQRLMQQPSSHHNASQTAVNSFVEYAANKASPGFVSNHMNVMLQRQSISDPQFISSVSQPHGIPMNIQHHQPQSAVSYRPIFITSQGNASNLSTVDTAGISLAGQIANPSSELSPQLSSQNQNRVQSMGLNPGVLPTVDNNAVKTSGDGAPRPTMVDLAIAASQRSYLASPSTLYNDTPIEAFSGSRGQTSTAPSVTTTTLPIPTVIISDSSPSNVSEATSGKRSRVRFENRDSYKEYRRRNHVSAEQRRRGLIKVAFDQMISLIPSLQADKQGRTSKALILQTGANYIEQLQRERELVKSKVEKLRMEVNKLNEEIKICQQQLPACGAISNQENVKSFKSSFLQHVRERIVQDHKYWIFAVLIRPLFQSFHETVVARTLQEFIQSVLQWFEDYCGLPRLRPVVISTLTQFSTNTAILTDPSSFPSQALEAAGRADPTIFGQQGDALSSSSSLQHFQVPLQGQSQESVLLPGQGITWMLQPSNETTDRK